ncbi:18070_t:CDS:1, partial [Gigaspora margarita]
TMSMLEWDDVKLSNIKEFNYSLFNVNKKIGDSEFSLVYSANFSEEIYALKSLNNNLDKNKFKQINQK